MKSFQHTLLLLRIVVAGFSTRFLQTSIVSIRIEYTKPFMYHKKLQGNSLGSSSTLARFTIHYTIFMYSLFENKRTIFTKFFLKSQNQPVNICLLWSDKTNWKWNHRVSTSAAKRKKLYPKNTMFCADFTKTIISRSLLLGEITRKYTACKKETTKEDEVNCL
jgi:hypothetical protein